VYQTVVIRIQLRGEIVPLKRPGRYASSKKAGRFLSRPVVAISFFLRRGGPGGGPPCAPRLVEPRHDLVNDAEEDCIVIFVLDKRAECFGMRVERRKVAGIVFSDDVGPVACTAGP